MVRAPGWFALVALVVLQTSRAHAAWTWTSDASCLEQDAAREAVADVLGAVVPEDVDVRGTIAGAPGAWRADVVVQRGEVSRSRSLTSEASACASMRDALVVVTALLIDEVLASAPEAAVLAIPTPAETPALSAEASWGGTIRMGALARFDELPGLVGSPLLEVEVLPPNAIPVLLSLGVWPPVERLVDARGGRFLGAFAMLGVCPRVAVDPAVEVGGCGALSFTYLRAEGIGAAETRTAEGLSSGIEGRAFVRVRIAGPLWIHGALGLVVPITRPRASLFVGTAELLVHQVAPLVPEGSLALELRFE